MKKIQILALSALVAAATLPTTAKAEDPVSPVQGAVCNLYLTHVGTSDAKDFKELCARLPQFAAAATFVDTAGEFKDVEKKDGIASDVGMWTGWLKVEKAGTYTFLCKRSPDYSFFRYSIWVNGQKCVEAVVGQSSFNVDLDAGFNSIKIISAGDEDYAPRPLSLSYKKAGSVKDPVSFGPADMFYDDEE